jgi:16S rRNA processing protein RimM
MNEPLSHSASSASPGAVPAELIQLGYVLDAWGTRGWVKIVPASSDAGALLQAPRLWLQSPAGRPPQHLSLEVREARRHAQAVVALLEGVDTRDGAEALRGWSVHARREDFPPTKGEEYYWVDLIGCQVVNREGVALGSVEGLLDSGAQSILRVRDSAAGIERLIPFVDAYVLEVDLAARRIVADWQPDFD